MPNTPTSISDEKLVFPSHQTQQVYAWEEAVFTDCYLSYLTLQECQQITNILWNDLNLSTCPPKVMDGRGVDYARAKDSTELHLPLWARNYTTLVHEFSHTVTDLIDPQDSYDHGGIYMFIYMNMITRTSNHKYELLLSSALAHGLRVRPIKLSYRLKTFQKIHMTKYDDSDSILSSEHE